MTADGQALWLASAEEALEGIRLDEIQAVSQEVRRSVTDHRRIVPKIADLVHERRKHRATARALGPPVAHTRISRFEKGPLSRAELDSLPDRVVTFGLRLGFLTRDNDGLLIETDGHNRRSTRTQPRPFEEE